jgi:penicillin-insensitive murein DD-endopeptidase
VGSPVVDATWNWQRLDRLTSVTVVECRVGCRMNSRAAALGLAIGLASGMTLASAQTKGAAPPFAVQPLPTPGATSTAPDATAPAQTRVPSIAKPPPMAAKILFGAARTASPLTPRAIGFYSKGCLAGGRALPIDGSAWQVMRLSRNRNWGHPVMIDWLERFAKEAQIEGWPGLLVGDIAQPRGGPMLTGHASHQIGLDADVWLTPMPNRRLTEKEREDLSATSMLTTDSMSVDPAVWTGRHVALIRLAALSPSVERVLVHPAIKKALCDSAGDQRGWLAKVRPYWGHYYHMHVRIACPPDSTTCRGQAPPPGDEGCGKEVDDWLRIVTRPPPPAPVKPSPPPRPMTLDQLPVECRVVLGRS